MVLQIFARVIVGSSNYCDVCGRRIPCPCPAFNDIWVEITRSCPTILYVDHNDDLLYGRWKGETTEVSRRDMATPF